MCDSCCLEESYAQEWKLRNSLDAYCFWPLSLFKLEQIIAYSLENQKRMKNTLAPQHNIKLSDERETKFVRTWGKEIQGGLVYINKFDIQIFSFW